MSDVEVRELRYFVAVAEELNFGRAAARLGMAQPPLSRAIRDLERRLGVQLLQRTTRQVTLTAAGEVFLRDARTALDAVSAAARRAQQAGQPAPQLRLALKADFDAGLLPQILATYQLEEAALPVEVMLGGRGEQAPALRDGRADVALLPEPFDHRGLDVEPLLTEPRLVALAAADPLASRPDLCLADLAGRTLPDGAPAWPAGAPGSPGGAAASPGGAAGAVFASPGRVAGTGWERPGVQAPQPVQAPQRDLAQIFNLVELGSIVCFVPVSVARRHSRPGVAYRSASDLEPSTLVLAWPRVSRSPAVAAFVRAAMTVAAQVDGHVITGAR
jgi:DNA-binding transcriptional LysR family regulator